MENRIAPPPPDSNEPANPGMPNFADIEALAAREQALSSERIEGQGDEEANLQPDGQPPADPDKVTSDIESLVGELGFKSPEELKKSFKEQHATITRLSQDRSNQAKEIEAIRQMVMAQIGQPRQTTTQGQGEDLNAQLYKEIAPFVENAVDHKVRAVITQTKVMEKMNSNKDEFMELLPFMTKVASENPHLDLLPNGIDLAYEKAKEMRDANFNNNLTPLIQKSMEKTLGMDVGRLKTLLDYLEGKVAPSGQGGLSEALAAASTVPGSSGGSKGGDQKIDFSSEIKKAQAANDIDRVVALSFARAQRKK